MKRRTSNYRKTKRPVVTNTPSATLAHAHPLPTTGNAAATPRTIAAVIEAKIESVEKKKAAAAKLEQSRYHHESRRPLVCLLFVLPMILAYELATIGWGKHAVRSGVDQWLDYVLANLGFGQLVLLPLVTAAALIIAHHRLDDHWKIRFSVLGGMLIETIGLGLMLFWAANALHLLSQTNTTEAGPMMRASIAPAVWWATTMAMVGSGIYEELFFRLLLLAPAIHFTVRWTKSQNGSWLAIVVVSLIFASLHYNFLIPTGASFEWVSFFFRFGASVLFSVLFLFRGFGIAAGTHVVFDVLTQL